jgi:hypothetical protein
MTAMSFTPLPCRTLGPPAEYFRREPVRPDPRNGLGRVLQTKQPVHIMDVAAEPAYAEREPLRVAADLLEALARHVPAQGDLGEE